MNDEDVNGYIRDATPRRKSLERRGYVKISAYLPSFVYAAAKAYAQDHFLTLTAIITRSLLRELRDMPTIRTYIKNQVKKKQDLIEHITKDRPFDPNELIDEELLPPEFPDE